jgi:hypothetical protein
MLAKKIRPPLPLGEGWGEGISAMPTSDRFVSSITKNP